MFALLCLGIAFALTTVVTLCALLSAKDGYEDSLGFHVVSGGNSAPVRLGFRNEETKDAAASPPFAAAS